MPNLIGTSQNQVPVNGMLGTSAFVNMEQLPVSTAAQTALDLKRQKDIVDYAPIVPTLDLNFAKGYGEVYNPTTGRMERLSAWSDLITFNAVAERCYTDAKGLLVKQTSGQPRITYDPVTGAGRGLSVWGSRTNLLTYSEQFDNAAWSKTNSTVTANTTDTTAPDGTTTADKLVENTPVSSSHLIQQSVAGITSGATMTWSFFAKAGERTKLLGYLNDNTSSTNRVTADFDLVTGDVTNFVNSGTFTGATATMTPARGGWFRCTLSGVVTGATGLHTRIYLRDATGTSTYAGDGTSGIYIWGAQLEAGSTASPYIPTTTGQITANADTATITGSNFTKWFNPVEGTFVVVSRPPTSLPSNGHVISASDGTSSNHISRRIFANATRDFLGTVGAWSINTADVSAAVGDDIATFSYGAAGFSSTANGASVSTDTTAVPALSALNQMRIGGYLNSALYTVDGTIARILYFPRSLASQLQALSA